MPVETICWKDGKIKFIDQTLLPHKLKYVFTDDIRRLWQAIKRLEIRGAPAIGIAGALGVVIGIKNSKAETFDGFLKELKNSAGYLGSSRPTAVNLFWALERMERVACDNRLEPVARIKNILLEEALKILEIDKKSCRRMARYGASLVKKGSRVLTHCNAGGLATADYGTALGVLFEAHRLGKKVKAYVDETRPLLQGARLTTWELMREGIDTTLICDNMAASLMSKGRIDMVFVGADRIAANGDAANKIGTYSLAVLAKYHRIPFYVVAPESSFDFNIESGEGIPIEERNGDEVRGVFGKLIAPKDVKAYNPAFDVTPNELITAIITERGIFRRPYRSVIARALSSRLMEPATKGGEAKNLKTDPSSRLKPLLHYKKRSYAHQRD
ncbi:MAG: S-methyl-5-thioribose-1-phosphate isomerase [Candidatus Omnitrophota bacterium]|nr:S-methyl-5-thioribose-1-phosphate isomerase [Candidatus Omnitrophota bacterium]